MVKYVSKREFKLVNLPRMAYVEPGAVMSIL